MILIDSRPIEQYFTTVAYSALDFFRGFFCNHCGSLEFVQILIKVTSNYLTILYLTFETAGFKTIFHNNYEESDRNEKRKLDPAPGK